MNDRPLTFAERLQHRVASALMRLPPAVQVRLSGSPPIVRDGLTLHPQLQLLLALRRAQGAVALSELPPVPGRVRLRREALIHAGVLDPVASATNLEVAGGAGPLRARHYAPVTASSAPQPLLVFLHGGGFVLGDLESHDALCRTLCHGAQVHVLSVDYRLAPEHPFPAAVEDALAAFGWAVNHATALGADPERVAIGGDSAGGNLSAVVTQQTCSAKVRAPVAQLLLYPALDRRTIRPSLELFAEGFFLTRADIEWFSKQYMGHLASDTPDVRLSPLLAPSLEGLSPAYVVTAGFDPLRDEGEAYAHALKAAGGRVVLRRFDSLVHGFASMGGVSPACREAVGEVASSFRALLDEVASTSKADVRASA